jgi:hypothetical protein
MPDTERINFDNGRYWEIRASLTVGLDREWSEICTGCMTLEGAEKANLADTIKAITSRLDPFILRVTTAWSYGPVTQETLLNQVPAPDYEKVTDRLVQLYSPLFLGRIERALNAFSSPSSPAASTPSPTSSPTPTSLK